MSWLSRNRVAVCATLLNIGAMGALVLALRWPSRGGIEILPPPTVAPTPSHVRVYVSGAVNRADVYVLPNGSSVKDAIEAAGGASSDADLDAINLAVGLVEADQVRVPRVGQPTAAATAPPVAVRSGSVQVNLNTASLAELDTLPGIGPVTAQAIIDYRVANGPFVSVESLLDVRGIGESTLSKIRDLVSVR